jgi:2-isopropylmalate synthase
VSVRLEDTDGRSVTGRGAEADTLVASVRAYVHGLNKLQSKSGSLHAQNLQAV